MAWLYLIVVNRDDTWEGERYIYPYRYLATHLTVNVAIWAIFAQYSLYVHINYAQWRIANWRKHYCTRIAGHLTVCDAMWQTFRDYSKLTLVIGVITCYSHRDWDDARHLSWYPMQHLYLFARLHLVNVNISSVTKRDFAK